MRVQIMIKSLCLLMMFLALLLAEKMGRLSRYYKVGVEVQVPHSASIDTRDGATPLLPLVPHCFLY